MHEADSPLSRLRAAASRRIARNALDLGLGPATGQWPPEGRPTGGWAPDDGRFQMALRPKAKQFVLDRMHDTGADKRFDRTIGAMTNGDFTPEEIKTLENRVLDQAGGFDVLALTGIAEGPPVDLSPHQKAVVDGLMGKLGSDPLARRARASFGKALHGGQVRIR